MATHLDEKLSKGYIHFSAILEIVGKPQEHVDATFLDFVKQIKSNAKFDVISDTVNESIPVEGSENLFSSYAELEVLVKNMGALFDFCFECMPASVEILAPSELRLKPNQASAAVNDLIGRIHQVDMQAKQLTQQGNVLSQNLRVMIENAIAIYLTHKPHRAEEIAAAIGVQLAQMPSFLNHMIETGRIVESDGVYGIAGKSIKKTEEIAADAIGKSSKSISKKPAKEEIIKIGKKKK